MTIASDLSRLLAPLRARIANLASRAIVSLVDDDKKLQVLQVNVLEGETRDGVERFQQYGFTSVPVKDAEALVIFVGGRREHGIAVAVDDRRYRLSGLAEGESALYTKFGSKVVLKADGSIEVTPKDGQDVKLAGGTSKVARKDDSTRSGTLSLDSSGNLTWTDESGTTTVIGTIKGQAVCASVTPAALVGKITSGADHAKA